MNWKSTVIYSCVIVVSVCIPVLFEAHFVKKEIEVRTGIAFDNQTGAVFTADLAVQRYDTESKLLYAAFYYKSINQFIPTILKVGPDMRVERQDAIVENDVIVGITPLTQISFDDVQPGMHGVGIVKLGSDGMYEINYLLVGDPFPRP